MCSGNSDPSEPDIACAPPATLVEGSELVEGRSAQQCCVVSGMCAGNTDAAAEPDVECLPPRTPKGPLHTMEGRSRQDCCDCFTQERKRPSSLPLPGNRECMVPPTPFETSESLNLDRLLVLE